LLLFYYAIYCDLSSAFALVTHTLHLHELSAFGLPGGYVNWLRSYVTNRQYQVGASKLLSSPFEVPSDVSQGCILGSCFSMCLLMTRVMHLTTLGIHFC
jgi:hypothetical protein